MRGAEKLSNLPRTHHLKKMTLEVVEDDFESWKGALEMMALKVEKGALEMMA